jgi:multicomponent Na+:H+ antiporter subunit G
MSLLADVASFVLLLAGSALVLIGSTGLLRLPDFFTRLHAAGITDTLGAALILFGLAFQADSGWVAVKLVLALVFLCFTGPVATHALARAALHGRLEPKFTKEPPSSNT